VGSLPEQSSSGAQAGLDFVIARAKAINTYAALEAMMAWLFSYLMKADERKSYYVFSRLVAPREKRRVLSKLMQISYPGTYTIFFRSLMARIGELDTPRNKIVHWLAVNTASGGEQIETLETEEMRQFTEKADFLRLVTYYFVVYLKNFKNLSTEREWLSWREIFQQQCKHPPQMDHPLVLMRKEHPTPHESSQL
jgi:hypothetical protein